MQCSCCSRIYTRETIRNLVRRIGSVDQGGAEDGFVGIREGLTSNDLDRSRDVEIQISEDGSNAFYAHSTTRLLNMLHENVACNYRCKVL